MLLNYKNQTMEIIRKGILFVLMIMGLYGLPDAFSIMILDKKVSDPNNILVIGCIMIGSVLTVILVTAILIAIFLLIGSLIVWLFKLD